MRGVVLFDFDGTLARREGLWRSALLQALDDLEPGHGIGSDGLRPHLRDRFPWHRPDLPHPELSTPEAWWGRVLPILRDACRANGFDEGRSAALAARTRERYVDPATHVPFPEARPALARLRDGGRAIRILSNHVPELPAIVEGCGLGDLIDGVVTSAGSGWEKPHPEAFRNALARAGSPGSACMVGDDPDADVRGAEAVGIPAIPVRDGALLAAAERILS